MRRKYLFPAITFVFVVLIGVVIWAIFTPFPSTTRIDWNMNAFLVTAEGQVAEEITLSVKGTVREYEEEADRLELEFTLPDSFRYMYLSSEYFSTVGKYFDWSYYASMEACYDRVNNIPAFYNFALDPNEKTVIIQWDDGSGQFLVAAQDPGKTPQEILEHYQGFLTSYAFRDK